MAEAVLAVVVKTFFASFSLERAAREGGKPKECIPKGVFINVFQSLHIHGKKVGAAVIGRYLGMILKAAGESNCGYFGDKGGEHASLEFSAA